MILLVSKRFQNVRPCLSVVIDIHRGLLLQDALKLAGFCRNPVSPQLVLLQRADQVQLFDRGDDLVGDEGRPLLHDRFDDILLTDRVTNQEQELQRPLVLHRQLQRLTRLLGAEAEKTLQLGQHASLHPRVCYYISVKAETSEWLKFAAEDMHVAALVLREGYSASCLFHCHQAIEKLLKALWSETRLDLPPKTHSLRSLVETLALAVSEEQNDFLQRLNNQYMPTRYPNAPLDFEDIEVGRYLSETQEFYSWLLPKLN